jgi:hypothetical protein
MSMVAGLIRFAAIGVAPHPALRLAAQLHHAQRVDHRAP